MSQAVHIGTNHAEQYEWFECPRCGASMMVTAEIWHSVPVMGEKPTLDVCEHRPHIPPSPSTLAAFERELLADRHDAEVERGKAILDSPASPSSRARADG